jgi:hypothetical protein
MGFIGLGKVVHSLKAEPRNRLTKLFAMTPDATPDPQSQPDHYVPHSGLAWDQSNWRTAIPILDLIKELHRTA